MVTGNPIVRMAFSKALEIEGTTITIQTLSNLLSELIEKYWTRCICLHTKLHRLKELKLIKERNALVDKFLKPLSIIGLLEIHGSAISLSPTFVKTLSVVTY